MTRDLVHLLHCTQGKVSIRTIYYPYTMGRSAKFAKRPTKKEKVASKTAKESRKPIPRQPSPVEERGDEEGQKGPKKRKMMRAKVDQVRG